MKAVWNIRADKGLGEQVGVITMEGDWRDPDFRRNFIKFVNKMNVSVSDSSEQTITEEP